MSAQPQQWKIEFVGMAPDEESGAVFRSEVLKLTALYGVQVNELHAHPHPFLKLVPSPPEDAA